MRRKRQIFLLFLLLPALNGCIRIEPRHDSGPIPQAGRAVQIHPAPGKQQQAFTALQNQLAQAKIQWDDINRYPAPEQIWREDRFRLLRPTGKIQPDDFQLKKITVLPNQHLRFIFTFLPLRVAYNGKKVWDTLTVFEFDTEGKIVDIRMFSEHVDMPPDGLLRLSPQECNAVSAVVLKALFQLPIPREIRAAERFRFCFPVNGSDEKFRSGLRPHARPPELDPYLEYPDFPVPFEHGRYRALTHGIFYYYAGIVLPVSEKTAWVFDTAIVYAGGQTSGTFYKLKKGLFFWEIITEGSYDARSRAVREIQEKEPL